MAQIEMPVPADKMAPFEINELPGRASMIDCALSFGDTLEILRFSADLSEAFGSLEDTSEASRAELSGVVRPGTRRTGAIGRRRVAPERGQQQSIKVLGAI